MKKTYFTILLTLCSSVAMANDNQAVVATEETARAENSNTIRIATRPEIVGLWGMQVANNNKCIEYYNFKSNNNVIIKSGQEWSSGIYDFQPAQEERSLLSALVLQVKYDNNEKDCSGLQEDQTGEISQYFVQWKNPSTINFCSNDKAEQCFATLRRVLP
ncbi:hypothetical protein B9T26_01665 [Acinetobacter sp. ANC 4169]|jgi:hypothetical protein|uniref:hypothetical protein n=1 Tax=Acinetobacter sp. ANC 4169 TaxID=1977879 RepID=UPI000A33263E|nr:hypothetical protein [Acinetobacter sp. ANC 4169]OTG76542.1 hypothetical protein B9T26_01665 [Acinetobacter sp. ANC 4169]